MKTSIFTLTLLFSWNLFASDLPFTVNRTEQGSIDSIYINDNKMMVMEADAFIDSIKASTQKMNALGIHKWEGFEKLKKEEQDAYLDSQSMMYVESLASVMDNNKLREEFAKAVRVLKSQKLFHLVASPNRPGDFDGENLLEELVGRLVDAAQNVLGTNPIFNVFEFLVEEYFDALIARREFVQNIALVYLQGDQLGATDSEKALIRSSIFYSRIAFYNLIKRQKALKAWATYGNKEQSKWMKKCKNTKATVLQACFTHKDGRIYNLVDKKHILSRKPSVAFNYNNPKGVGDDRWMILAAKLALKLAPIPSLVTKPVEKWLESLYADQRRTEGLLYGSAYLAGENSLAAWVKRNTANPTLKF